VTELWDLSSDRMIRLLPGGSQINALAFSPDGKLLATGGQDNHVRLWNVATGTLRVVLSGNTGPVESVSFSPDGKFLAGSSAGGMVRLWSVPSGAPYGSVSTTSNGEVSQIPPQAVAFAPEGEYLYTSSPGSGQIDRYDLTALSQSGTVTRLPGGAGLRVYRLATVQALITQVRRTRRNLTRTARLPRAGEPGLIGGITAGGDTEAEPHPSSNADRKAARLERAGVRSYTAKTM
jgi:hypothetical protein